MFVSVRLSNIILFVLLFPSFLMGQSNKWRQFGVEQGLPQSNITCATQDKIGYLWLGTKGSGLVRFDGKNFKQISQREGLNSGFITSIYAHNDTLFIGTNKGLNILYNNKITPYEAPEIISIKKLENKIYLASQSGVYSWNSDYLQPLKIDNQIDNESVLDFAFDGEYFWLASNFGLWKIDRLERPEKIKKIGRGAFGSLVSSGKELYVTKKFSGIYNIHDNRLKKVYSSKFVESIVQLQDYIYIVSEDKGLQRFTKDWQEDRLFYSYHNLHSAMVQWVFSDTHKNIWVGTANAGILKYIPNTFKNFTKSNGLNGQVVRATAALNNTLWLATSQGGIDVIKNDSVYQIDRKHLQRQKVKGLAIDKDQNLWIATMTRGLLLLKRDSIRNDTLIDVGKQLFNIGNSVSTIRRLNNSIWLTDNRFLHELKIKKGSIQDHIVYTKEKGLQDPMIITLYGEDDTLWYGTENGNLGFVKNGKLVDYFRVINKEVAITSIESYDNSLLLGTAGEGVWICSKSNPKDIVKLEGQALNSENIRQLIVDQNKTLWVGTVKGLNKLVLNGSLIKNISYYSKNEGFTSIETTSNTAEQLSDGSLWFGTVNGVSKYINVSNQKKDNTTEVFIETIKVNFENFKFHSNLDEENHVLKSNENNISFTYKSVDLNYPNALEYQWNLNGKYSPWTRQTTIDFANLNYGYYEFSVKSRNRDFIESRPQTFKFTIEKPWYLKDIFLLSVIAFILIFGGFVVQLYIQYARKKSLARIEKLTVENQIISWKQKALQLQMNPHFVFNVLNSIKALGSTGKINEMKINIQSFSKLMRGILNNSRLEWVSLQSELDILHNYVSLETQLTMFPIEFKVDLKLKELDTEEILIPPMIMQPFVENAIKHAFSTNKPDNAVITLSFNLYQDVLNCSIRDNGIGYHESIKRKKSNHKSAAIDITKKRLESLSSKSNFKIEELKEDKLVTGTLVSFNLPYKTDF